MTAHHARADASAGRGVRPGRRNEARLGAVPAGFAAFAASLAVVAQQAGDEVGLDMPHSARVLDYLQRGKDNFAVDRAVAEAVIDRYPGAPGAVRAHRAFHQRVVRFLAQQGVAQFLDLGCGLPTTRPSTYEIAHRVNDGCRVVYADNDPMVLNHARVALAIGRAVVVDADLIRPDQLLDLAVEQGRLDLAQPVGVLALLVLDCLTGPAARTLIDTLTARLAPGSWLAVSHTTTDLLPVTPEPEPGQLSSEENCPLTLAGMRSRSALQVTALLQGLDLQPAGNGRGGLVLVNQWRPEPGHEHDASVYATLARTPHPDGPSPSAPAGDAGQPQPAAEPAAARTTGEQQ